MSLIRRYWTWQTTPSKHPWRYLLAALAISIIWMFAGAYAIVTIQNPSENAQAALAFLELLGFTLFVIALLSMAYRAFVDWGLRYAKRHGYLVNSDPNHGR